jgi:ribosome biogenesis GTPase
VGDHVLLSLNTSENQEGVIEEIEKRKNKFSRPAVRDHFQEQVVVSNLDQLIVVAAVQEDSLLPFGTLDRFLCAGENAGIPSILCINKIDLAQRERVLAQLEPYQKMNYQVLLTSAHTKENLGLLENLLKNRISVFCGPSGVGKSSLLTTIQPDLNLKTGQVNPKTQAGRHVTSSVSLLKLKGGGYVVDTPGIREIGLWNLSSESLEQYFLDFASFRLSCRYRSCLHYKEPDCAVKGAVEAQEIHAERYSSYLRILASLVEEEGRHLDYRKT